MRCKIQYCEGDVQVLHACEVYDGLSSPVVRGHRSMALCSACGSFWWLGTGLDKAEYLSEVSEVCSGVELDVHDVQDIVSVITEARELLKDISERTSRWATGGEYCFIFGRVLRAGRLLEACRLMIGLVGPEIGMVEDLP